MTAQTIESWQEVFLFSIQVMDGTEVQYAGITEEITNFEWGEKDVEGTPLANGGRNMKWNPQGDGTCTLKVYPVDAKLTGNGFAQIFNPQTTADSTEPIKVVGTRNRNKYQLIFTWAEDLITTITTAGQVTTADKAAYRRTIKNAYCTNFKWVSEDRRQGAEVAFKWGAFGLTGNANYKEESTSTTAIPVKTDFTTANQFGEF
jgi:hypothetical protein